MKNGISWKPYFLEKNVKSAFAYTQDTGILCYRASVTLMKTFEKVTIQE